MRMYKWTAPGLDDMSLLHLRIVIDDTQCIVSMEMDCEALHGFVKRFANDHLPLSVIPFFHAASSLSFKEHGKIRAIAMDVVLRHLLFCVLMCDVTPTPLARAYLAPNQVLCAKTLFSFAYMRKMLSTRCGDLMVADNIEHVPGLARFVPLFKITRHRCELAMAALPLRRAHSRGVRSTCCASL